nr:hypothetical protein [Mycoplasmopsis bovis]
MNTTLYINNSTAEIPTKEKINIIKTLRLIDKEMDKAKLVREKFNNLLRTQRSFYRELQNLGLWRHWIIWIKKMQNLLKNTL